MVVAVAVSSVMGIQLRQMLNMVMVWLVMSCFMVYDMRFCGNMMSRMSISMCVINAVGIYLYGYSVASCRYVYAGGGSVVGKET